LFMKMPLLRIPGSPSEEDGLFTVRRAWPCFFRRSPSIHPGVRGGVIRMERGRIDRERCSIPEVADVHPPVVHSV